MARQSKVLDELTGLIKAHGGIVTPQQVVAYAKNPKTALHSQFEWDDTEAAQKWRVHQARNLLRVFVEVIDEGHDPVRAMVSLIEDRGPAGGYRMTRDVLKHKVRREQLLRMALRDMDIFTAKYRVLNELADVFAAMSKVRRGRRALVDEKVKV